MFVYRYFVRSFEITIHTPDVLFRQAANKASPILSLSLASNIVVYNNYWLSRKVLYHNAIELNKPETKRVTRTLLEDKPRPL